MHVSSTTERKAGRTSEIGDGATKPLDSISPGPDAAGRGKPRPALVRLPRAGVDIAGAIVVVALCFISVLLGLGEYYVSAASTIFVIAILTVALVAVKDTTDNPQAELERAQLSDILQSSDDAIVSTTPDGAIRTVRGVGAVYRETGQHTKTDAANTTIEARLRAVLDNNPEFVAVFSPKGDCIEINRAGLAMLEAESIEQIRARGACSFLLPEYQDGFAGFFREATVHGSAELEFEIGGMHGTRRRLQARAARLNLPEDGNVNLLVIAHDVTEHRRTQEQVEYLSHHDVLTGLPNRGLFQDRLALAVAHAKRRNEFLGILLINLKRFGKVNESLGQEAGDELLARVAERLKTSLREVDTIARFGGNEFSILIEGIASADDVAALAEKIDGMFATPFHVRGHEMVVSASVGAAVCANGECAAGTLLGCADIAVSRAKTAGGGYHLYQDEPITLSGRRFSLETHLRRALEDGTLAAHYQPQVNLKTRAIIGAEALLRWHCPALGEIAPDQFIPIAEETGLIVPIGAWVLETACTQAARWRREGYDLNVSVNLSPRQFRQKHLVTAVAGILARSGLDAADLVLEITEGTAMSNVDQTIAILGELRQLGVKLALDDFGTGYSSLSYLQRFPLHSLKIDQSFVRHATIDASSATIVRATVALAHGLHLDVLAEGIETESQRDFLEQVACDEGQGFLFSRAVPEAEFRRLLAVGRKRPGRGT